ncbi:MAG: hypothetical protein AAF597_21450 [Bacteroidota bacterium]
MNSLSRILQTSRALIAEIPLISYCYSILLFLLFIVIQISGENSYSIGNNGLLGTKYNFIFLPSLNGFFLGSVLIASAITGIGFFNREFKEENRVIRLMGLPLSKGERNISLALIHLLFLPIIHILPIFIALAFT